MTYAGAGTITPQWVAMNELSSAETALSALRPVLSVITIEELHLPTPCPGFDVAALADHLLGTITLVGAAAGSDPVRTNDGDIRTEVTAVASAVIEAWRRRGTEGDTVFAGRTMPATLALGVLSVELVVHGWDFAQALGRPLTITAAHADFVLDLARHIITPDSRRTAGFDDPIPVTTDAEALDRLVAFTGRVPRGDSRPREATIMADTPTPGIDDASAAFAPNRTIDVASDVLRYRRVGSASSTLPPLVMLQHFRGNLDYWDPLLIDTLAGDREVITVDLPGVGGSGGQTPDNVSDMARNALGFVDALGLTEIDLLGFSLGGHIAQEIALVRPRLPRRLVLAGTAPQGAPDLHRWSEDVYRCATGDVTAPEDFIALFFSGSDAGVQRAWEYLARTHIRQQDRDIESSLACRDAQFQALMTWGIPESGKLDRLAAITQPTLVANGDNDTMMHTKNSRLLAEHIRGAQLRIYPDSGHGFLDQYPVEFGQHVRQFLGR